jgi:hypothetical protein
MLDGSMYGLASIFFIQKCIEQMPLAKARSRAKQVGFGLAKHQEPGATSIYAACHTLIFK